MNTEQLRAEFEAWYEKQMGEAPKIAEDMYTPFATACWEAYQAGRAAMQSQDKKDADTEATGGDENGGHRLVEPDYETALALADAPRSLRNYVAALRSAIALQSQVKNDRTLFCDLKTDEEKSAFFLSGRGYETGVIAPSIQNDVAMAYHRCAEYRRELEDLQSQDREDAERLDDTADIDEFREAIDHARNIVGGKDAISMD